MAELSALLDRAEAAAVQGCPEQMAATVAALSAYADSTDMVAAAPPSQLSPTDLQALQQRVQRYLVLCGWMRDLLAVALQQAACPTVGYAAQGAMPPPVQPLLRRVG